MNKLSLINLPLDALHNIIEFFDRDEWPIFKNINIPLGTLNFDMLHNYEPVDIYVLPNGRLSKEPNPKDLFKRFIVSSDTINFLVRWKDIVSIILINSTDLRFDTISKNIIFEEFIKKKINIDDVNRPPDDDEFVNQPAVPEPTQPTQTTQPTEPEGPRISDWRIYNAGRQVATAINKTQQQAMQELEKYAVKNRIPRGRMYLSDYSNNQIIR